jgi:hypothetical protein
MKFRFSFGKIFAFGKYELTLNLSIYLGVAL